MHMIDAATNAANPTGTAIDTDEVEGLLGDKGVEGGRGAKGGSTVPGGNLNKNRLCESYVREGVVALAQVRILSSIYGGGLGLGLGEGGLGLGLGGV